MHFCGDFIHDIFVNLAIALPFLTGVSLWLRIKFGAKCLKENKCNDPHTHIEDHSR
jgi:hypothetical protein